MITVFGSINVDLTFQLNSLPSIGETVLTPAFTEAIGGKGANQAVAARRDGADTRFIGCIGDDEFGLRARNALQDEGIHIEELTTVAGKSGLASIWIDAAGDNMIAVASGANARVTSDMVPTTALTADTILVLQMEVPTNEIEQIIERAKERGSQVLLNLAPALPLPSEALKAVDYLVLNEHEAQDLGRQMSIKGENSNATVRALASELEATVITTLGAAGVTAFHKGELNSAAALPVTPVDTTGAGDCFVGVLASSLDAGMAFDLALSRAAAAASLACTVVGTVPSFPTRSQIDEAAELRDG